MGTCPSGSFTVLGHWQEAPDDAASALGATNFTLVTTVEADLRDSYTMVEAELNLFEVAAGTAVGNGCVPQWVQLLSDSSMPAAACDSIHSSMATLPHQSMIQARDCEPYECGCANRRPHAMRDDPAPFMKASQWSLLTMADAQLLVDTR